MNILFYTSNPNKITEFRSILKDQSIRLLTAESLSVQTKVPETGLTFVENAIIKARDGARQSSLPCIADDSGLVVDCLQGKPGILSARYAGPESDADANIAQLLADLSHVETQQRTARFVCCIVFLRRADDPSPIVCCDVMEGLITNFPSGFKGFGYDPIFYLPGYQRTVAEISPMLKNRISHRGKALRKMAQSLETVVHV